MAVLVFLVRGHLGRRARLAARQERRIVAEATAAAAAVEDLAFPGALADQGVRVVEALDEHHDTAISRTTARGGNALQRRQQLGEIVLVAGTLTRVSRRVHARRSTESIHFDAGIVRDRRQAREAR